MAKSRIRLTDKELGVIHRILCDRSFKPSVYSDNPDEVSAWRVLSDLSCRATLKESCFCGDYCTCGG